MFFIFGDADGVRLDHIAEMYRLKGGGEIHGDMQPRSPSRLAILPDTTHERPIHSRNGCQTEECGQLHDQRAG